MCVPGLSMHAFLIVDNCVLSMLCDYCAHRATGMPRARLIQHMREWATAQFNILKQFTPDGHIHCTDCVANEFNGYAGSLSHEHRIGFNDCKLLVRHVCGLLRCTSVGTDCATVLRGLPAFPHKLFGPNRLGDNDISLVELALQLATNGSPVYVLTNDQDLLTFVSWIRTKREVRELWGDPSLVQGLQSLTYLELVHRECSIETETMVDLLNFVMLDHSRRKELAGTQKGDSIVRQIGEINKNLVQSVIIKTRQGEAL